MCGNCSCLAHFKPPRHNPKTVSTYTRYLHEVSTVRIAPTFGLKVDDIEKKEELNTSKKNVSEIDEDKVLTHFCTSEKSTRTTMRLILDKAKGNHEDDQKENLEEVPSFVYEFEKYNQERRKTID